MWALKGMNTLETSPVAHFVDNNCPGTMEASRNNKKTDLLQKQNRRNRKGRHSFKYTNALSNTISICISMKLLFYSLNLNHDHTSTA